MNRNEMKSCGIHNKISLLVWEIRCIGFGVSMSRKGQKIEMS